MRIIESFLFILIISLLNSNIQCQQCLALHPGSSSVTVQWFVMLLSPKSTPFQYLYMDSNSANAQFQIRFEQADTYQTPFYRTISQIQNLKMQYIAWNDQLPNGTVSQSKAHSKALLTYMPTGNGFLLSHSLPKFPTIINSFPSPLINPSQRVYGQHIVCISMPNWEIQQYLSKLLGIRPYIYATNIQDYMNSNQNKNNRETSSYGRMEFGHKGVYYMFVFKYGKNSREKDGGVLEQETNRAVGSSMLAISWGRPLLSAWCPLNFKTRNLWVGNIKSLRINYYKDKQSKLSYTIASINSSLPNIMNFEWPQSKQHSKQSYTVLPIRPNTSQSIGFNSKQSGARKQFGCFGDLNRVESQNKRSGAYYCIQSQLLRDALESITGEVEDCYSGQYQKGKFQVYLFYQAISIWVTVIIIYSI